MSETTLSDATSLAQCVNTQVVEDAERIGSAFRSAEPFRHVVIDDFFDEAFCQRLIDEFPPFDEEKAMNEDGYVGGKAVFEKIRALGDTYAELDALVQGEPFMGLVSTITGIPGLRHDPYYFGGGTHENREGQGLDAHVDFNYHPVTRQHRRLNLIVYLNPEWDDAWGGTIQLHRDPYLPPSQDEIIRVTPLSNRCVIFEASETSYHGHPEPLACPPDRTRKSIALYYYTETHPDRSQDPVAHSTLFPQRQNA